MLKSMQKKLIAPNEIALIGLGNLAKKLAARFAADDPETKMHGYSPSGRTIAEAFTYTTIDATINQPGLKFVVYLFKPQHWSNELQATIKQAIDKLADKPLKISVLAGLSLQELNCDITCMPNILCEVGKSYTFAQHRADLSPSQLDDFCNLMQHTGPVQWLNTPDAMHLAVACSGSAPAYFIYAMQAVVATLKTAGATHQKALDKVIATFHATALYFQNTVQQETAINWSDIINHFSPSTEQVLLIKGVRAYCLAMQRLGLDKDLAPKVAANTFLGSVELVQKMYAEDPNLDLNKILASIMSKGGTTEQAIKVAKDATFAILASDEKLNSFIFDMLNAAFEQSKYLQQNAKKKLVT